MNLCRCIFYESEARGSEEEETWFNHFSFGEDAYACIRGPYACVRGLTLCYAYACVRGLTMYLL